MRRIAPVGVLLALTACARSEPPTVAITPSPAVSPAPANDQSFDAMLRELAGKTQGQSSPAPSSTTRTVIYTIAPVSPAIAAQVEQEATAAEYQTNLAGCLDGRFPAICDHAMLTPSDVVRVRQAEFEANPTTCIDPEWQHLCNPELLPKSDQSSEPAVHRAPTSAIALQPTAARPAVPAWQPVIVPSPRYTPGGSESGSCYGDISTLTGRPKTTYVRGYFRRNGTYVRSYYRSGRWR